MRPAPEFSTTGRAGSTTPASPPSGAAPHSPWHSPVPYLFGGLAAMLGLIAFALLILACSYWKLSGYLESEGDSGAEQHDDGAEKPGDGSGKQSPAFFEEKILVIMAGDCKPTFLATPIAIRAASFADKAGDGTAEDDGEVKAADGAVDSPPADATRDDDDDDDSHRLSGDDGGKRNSDQSSDSRSL